MPGARLETVVVLTSNRRSKPPRLQSGSVFRERNMTLLRFTAFLCFIATSMPVFAQQYLSRPIRILIPFTVGSAADIIARAMEPQLRGEARAGRRDRQPWRCGRKYCG